MAFYYILAVRSRAVAFVCYNWVGYIGQAAASLKQCIDNELDSAESLTAAVYRLALPQEQCTCTACGTWGRGRSCASGWGAPPPCPCPPPAAALQPRPACQPPLILLQALHCGACGQPLKISLCSSSSAQVAVCHTWLARRRRLPLPCTPEIAKQGRRHAPCRLKCRSTLRAGSPPAVGLLS